MDQIAAAIRTLSGAIVLLASGVCFAGAAAGQEPVGLILAILFAVANRPCQRTASA